MTDPNSDLECEFCRQATGNDRSLIICEDDELVAALAKDPIAQGHMRIMPRRHIVQLAMVDESIVTNVFRTGYRLLQAMRKTDVAVEGSIWYADDSPMTSRGNEHWRLEIVPRARGDEMERAARRSCRYDSPRLRNWPDPQSQLKADEMLGRWMTARLEAEAAAMKTFATQLRAAYRELYRITERNSDAHAKK